jgi:hypothetical protein
MSAGDWTIPEEEQRRIIERTGILHDKGIRPSQLRRPSDRASPLIRVDELSSPKHNDNDSDEDGDNGENSDNDDNLSPLADELFTDFLWLVIFTFLFIGLYAVLSASLVGTETTG